MNTFFQRRTVATLFAGAVIATLAGCAQVSSMASKVTGGLPLSGAQEVPPVNTSATGTSTIAIAGDGSVAGSVKTTGIVATMAHIHMGPAGQNGPVIVPLTKSGDNEWSVPSGAKLTPAQLAAHKSGSLYVNVHSDAHKGGEIRAQLKP
ncbi:CHRD domain-containing protein [Hydrogenophaga sp. BPS33]|uniref:CHRD domain-containing protein n=1 Tax=Hydrogenophaga sp. BPS33 TaxID=2651974 RepID=UPI0013201165|nr:CHRD domain-containing protein [Hydrogenophaga sp. BPS33]QHE87012.1 CHRD domain-containing protein [Hydrogenophaga sp. BPS33]